MNIPATLKKLIQDHQDEINNNEFDNLYADWTGPTYKLTFILLEAGIDPLETLGWVPEDYARGLLTVTEAHINDDVTLVGKYAFFKCYNLNSVYLPPSIETISSFAFSGCYNLKEVHYGGTIEELKQVNIGKYSFEEIVVFICQDGEITFIELVNYWIKK